MIRIRIDPTIRSILKLLLKMGQEFLDIPYTTYHLPLILRISLLPVLTRHIQSTFTYCHTFAESKYYMNLLRFLLAIFILISISVTFLYPAGYKLSIQPGRISNIRYPPFAIYSLKFNISMFSLLFYHFLREFSLYQ